MQGGLLVLGAIAWVIALVCGITYATDGTAHPPAPVRGTDVVAAAIVLGFALAGGLCVLGAAVAEQRNDKPRPRGKTDIAAVLDQLHFTGMLSSAEYDAIKRKLSTGGSAGTGA